MGWLLFILIIFIAWILDVADRRRLQRVSKSGRNVVNKKRPRVDADELLTSFLEDLKVKNNSNKTEAEQDISNQNLLEDNSFVDHQPPTTHENIINNENKPKFLSLDDPFFKANNSDTFWGELYGGEEGSSYLVAQLTPSKFLSNDERSKRMQLKGKIDSNRLSFVHDIKDSFDKKAVKIYFDKVNIGNIKKLERRDEINNFFFSDLKLKSNIQLFWTGRELLFKHSESNKCSDVFLRYGIYSIWHMTHIDNIKSIISTNISSNSIAHRKFKPIDISNGDVQHWRRRLDDKYKRPLHNYCPTYINIRNPMLYAKRDINDSLCLIEIDIKVIDKNQYVFTDGNAASRNTKFFYETSQLSLMPWDILNDEFWNHYQDGKRKRCSELLVYPSISCKYIKAIHCNNLNAKKLIEKRVSSAILISVSPELFF